MFAELPEILEAGDLLVFNDTRVIPARLAAKKQTGGKAEILIERIEGERSAVAQVRGRLEEAEAWQRQPYASAGIVTRD